jgi:glycine/D-amino acid oxidase-like deaminating enzyme
LIVGAGLAGCLLAWRLQQAGQHFFLIGSTAMPSAFGVAAGVINPVTGRWMTKTWNFDQLLPKAEETYRAIEQQFGIQIYHPIPEIRFCQNAEDLKRAGRRMRNPRYRNVLSHMAAAGKAAPEFNDEYGTFHIDQAAYVDLPLVVNTLRASFATLGVFRDETFLYSKLKASLGAWQYQDIYAQNVIFCEGAAIQDNPWFKNVPIKPTKGETLLCQSPTIRLPQKLYHHKKWFLPYSNGTFRIGATYDESDLSNAPTEAKKDELLRATHGALKEPHQIKVTAHLAGIRPSTHDSRPIIGPHPTESGLYLINGLGSKGASTAPAMTQQLTDHILNKSPIDDEVKLARFD